MSNFNYNSKFKEGQRVIIAKGYHAGKAGKIEYVYGKEGLKPAGLFETDNFSNGNEFSYMVNPGLFRANIYCYESDLVAV